MKAILRLLAFGAGGMAAAVALGFGVLFHEFDAPGPHGGPTIVVVPKGIGVSGIADLLARQGVLQSALVFKAGVRVTGAAAGLRAGEYEFPGRASARDVMDVLRSGKTVVRKLTAPEGTTTPQIMALVTAAHGMDGLVGPMPEEGALLPDTYHYSWGDRRVDMVGRMERAMSETVARLWRGRAPGVALNSPDDAVILASIVERETGKAEERALIAGVFYNRLRLGMPLQSDPTVAYGRALAEGIPERTLGRALSRKDLETPDSFNTYLNRGLPPEPICNPGLAALTAVLHPARTEALYFVADGNGGHAFARTLEEHNRNVRRWRELTKAAKDGAAAPIEGR
ncbi:MAG: hypothetical protein RL477_1402 [Pseudomonadota bacterium]